MNYRLGWVAINGEIFRLQERPDSCVHGQVFPEGAGTARQQNRECGLWIGSRRAWELDWGWLLGFERQFAHSRLELQATGAAERRAAGWVGRRWRRCEV